METIITIGYILAPYLIMGVTTYIVLLPKKNSIKL